MIQASPKGGVNTLRTLKKAHTAAVSKHEALVINGQVLVAVSAADADAENIYIFRGPVEFPKEDAVAHIVGDVVYLDTTNENITKTSTDNTMAGIVKEDAAAAASTVLVELAENK